jgi:hypothetical protein
MKTYELLMTGYRYRMCGGVKWKNMMLTASRVRRPVSAGMGAGLAKAGAAGARSGAEMGAGASGVRMAAFTGVRLGGA